MPIVYEILVVPTVRPVTRPADTLATAPLLLLHIPPATVSVKATVLPVHTVALAGANAVGVLSTVIDFVAEQPAPVVYKMFVVPAATPVTVPEVPTVAVPGDALLHVPPAVTSPSEAVAPTHMFTAPGGVIAAGLAFTVTGAPTAQVPMV